MLQEGRSAQLSSMHLRKAKLMFFYTRYPSSALLKAFFPDVRFDKKTTAQLVKWFSNFRCAFADCPLSGELMSAVMTDDTSLMTSELFLFSCD